MKPATVRLTDDLPWAGKGFVISGRLEQFSRPQAEAIVRELGGRASGTVTRRTAYLVAGEAAGSKLERAQHLEIPVLDEATFIRMVREARDILADRS
ncbi:MAG: hypothetical protein O3B84_01070 [Chloroflexi bacterium]|nr:hypothetical protein [Chloroflexota bacterium]